MLKNVFAAVRREQLMVIFFNDVRDVRESWIESSYKFKFARHSTAFHD